MKKYFVYELKKALIPFLVIAFAGIIVYFIPLAVGSSINNSFDEEYIGYLMLVLAAACAILPIEQFSYKMKRRSIDLFYSLPLTRTKQLAVRYIVGFATIICAYTAAYLLGFIITAINYGGEIKLIYYLPLYFAAIIPAYVIYSISSFAFTRANSVIDGIFFVVFSMVALFFVVVFLSIFTKYKGEAIDPNGYDTFNYLYSYKFFPFTMLDEVTCVFQGLICGDALTRVSPFADMSDPEAINIAVSFAVFTALSIGCSVALFMTEHNVKAENCNQASDSVFGYKTMLPLTLLVIGSLLGMDWLDSADAFMLLVILIGIVYMVAALYKKSFKIGWKYALVMLGAVVVGIVCGIITGGVF